MPGLGGCLICHRLPIRDINNDVGVNSTIVITSKVAEALESHAISGWRTFPVSLKCRKQVETGAVPELCELLVVGDGGTPLGDPERYSRVVCPDCGLWDISPQPDVLVLNENDWDGSDTFYFAGRRGPYVTERLKDFVEASRLDGVAFRPTSIPRTSFLAQLEAEFRPEWWW